MKYLNSFCRTAETEYAFTTDKVNVFFYDLPKHFNDDYRSYEAPRLCTILQGSKKVAINQAEQFSYRDDQCVLLPPHSSVHMSMTEYTRALVYEFSDDMIDDVRNKLTQQLEMDEELHFDYRQFQLEDLQARLNVLHHRAQDILHLDNDDIPFLMELNSQEMVYELLKRQSCLRLLSHHKHHPINRAIQTMKRGDGLLMSVSELAEEVDMSLPNFSQKFKLVTNQTPKEYATKLRMRQSKRYLQTMSVTDTAMELGYENISHYIRLFKKEFGLTPKQFKLSLQSHH